jgi:histone H3/H4
MYIHRRSDAGAFEKMAPRAGASVVEKEEQMEGQRKTTEGQELLVVGSKVKKYIKDAADMNASASTMDELMDRILLLCDRSIENARRAGRKTVMDRDIPKLVF